jgi:hypothetical protein
MADDGRLAWIGRYSSVMALFENVFFRYALLAVTVPIVGALLYFIWLGGRALFREALGIARQAGHRPRSAAVRAILRMAIWAAYFGAFYLLAFFVGKRLGWWAVPPVLLALAAMIWSLLLADRLLTVTPGNVRQQMGIGLTIALILLIFTIVILAAV